MSELPIYIILLHSTGAAPVKLVFPTCYLSQADAIRRVDKLAEGYTETCEPGTTKLKYPKRFGGDTIVYTIDVLEYWKTLRGSGWSTTKIFQVSKLELAGSPLSALAEAAE